MKRIGILILLFPVCVSADIGFHPIWALGESNVFFTPKTTNSLLNFNLLQTADTSYNTSGEKSSLYKHSYEAMGGFLGEVLGGLIGTSVAIIGLSMFGGVYFYGDNVTAECGFLLGALPGAIIGLPKGVGFVGKKLGEDGDYWNTFLGMALGSVVGFLVGGYTMSMIDEKGSGVVATVVGVGVGNIFSIAGAVWGYNW